MQVLVDYVVHGDYTVSQAMEAAADILFHNSNRLYGLNQKPCYEPSRAIRHLSALSSGSLEDFIRNNPDVKFVWMQWVDYTATIRTRMFPIQEFARIVRKERRIGISLSVCWMVQDDSIAPEGSAAGQFYMEPDLSSLCRNVVIPSKSATVMTYWRSEEGRQLEGCPRTTLQNIVDKLKLEHDLDVMFGFEIETVFLKRSPDPVDPKKSEYAPAVNHSWSRMTSETQTLLPLLEEIVETLASININLEQFHAESSPSQFEFVLPPSTPLAAVDTLHKTRQVIIDIARKHGLRATLHPRPVPGAAGNAAHAHVSISPPDKEDSFLAGIMQHYPAVVALTLAQDSSYARVKSGIWAGSEWVTWGTQNRETPIRKIGPGHWEFKSLDGLANMYLAMSAVVAAGYLGVSQAKPLTLKDCSGMSLHQFAVRHAADKSSGRSEPLARRKKISGHHNAPSEVTC